MTEILNQPIRGASAWRGSDRRDDRWIHPLSVADAEEIRRALDHARRRRVPLRRVGVEAFPLPTLGPRLVRLRRELDAGSGFAVVRGIPVEGYSTDELETIAIGLSRHLGRPIGQNVRGSLVDHVADRGASFEDISVRGYSTNAALTPHCDSGDVVALLSVRKAERGGESTIASFGAVHNRILAERPELLAPLYRGFHYNIRGCGPPGPWRDVTRHRVPVYTVHRGLLSGRFNAKAIRTATELPGVPPLTPLEQEAIDRVESLALDPELRLDMLLEPGDLQLLCNHTILHTRSAFVDGSDPRRRRLLLRVWINVPGGRPLPREFDDHYNTGPRRGPFVHEPEERRGATTVA
jgi:hypothetical protein